MDSTQLAHIASENKEIIMNGYYTINGRRVYLGYTQGARTFLPKYPIDNSHIPQRASSNGIRISVQDIDVITCALANPDCMLLNFASGFHPGGGYLRGSRAQEETICRCSTLYAQIDGNIMYDYSRKHDTTHSLCTDAVSVTTDTQLFRDKDYHFINDPVYIGIITAAAPNCKIRPGTIDISKLAPAAMEQRIRRIVDVAVMFHYPVLLLGAFGCGAFHNNPYKTAASFKKVLVDENRAVYFDKIIFPIPVAEDNTNFNVFKEVLES